MKIYFIGAGPGAADLITLRGAKILNSAKLVLYAGSLVSKDMLSHCDPVAEIIDTAKLNLDEQEQHYIRAKENNWDVARLHSGDPAIYGATSEQMRRLDKLDIPYEVVPGVSTFLASAAAITSELTKPNVSQTIILTRTQGRASPMPEGESLKALAAHQATLCIFLSGANMSQTISDLLTHYSAETPVALIQKASWPQEKIHRSTLGQLLGEIEERDWLLSTMMLVGKVLDNSIVTESKLYDASYSHRFRKAVS